MERTARAPGRHMSLRGRAEECAALDAFLADVRRGQSRSLVVFGEAGIGKTALLQYLLESASELTVLRALGVESEMELAYASLHQLIAPLLDRLGHLPGPQRDAVRVAFGETEGPPPDRFLVGLGVLGLLSQVAEERPLLCAVDDAQWLDRASALTLAFVARRLVAEPVGIVFAAREPGEELHDLAGLEVHGLHNGDARALLGTAVQFVLDNRVRERIIAETRGNPLALLELPHGLTAAQLTVGFGLQDPHALPGRIEESFIRRLEALPAEVRRLLLVAAADPVGDPILLWGAVARLDIEPGVADHARREGLLAIDDRVIFRHPLVRSAVYGSAVAEDRRAAHLALAEVTDREADPDRRAWHLAAAAAQPDEEVATELERSADRAQARGGMAAMAAFLKRSVALTLDPLRRAQRALAAAQAHLQAGSFEEALRLVGIAEAGSLDELARARVELLRGQIAFASAWGGGAPALMLLKAARQLEPLDPALARDTYLDAWVAAWFAGRFAPAGTLGEICRAARSAPKATSAPRPSDLLLDGLAARVVEGRTAAEPGLSLAASVFAHGELALTEGLRWGWLATAAATMLWDDDSWHVIVARQLQSLRDAGLLLHLPIYLQSLGILPALRGDFATARSLIAEGDTVAEATGTRLARFAAIALAGLRGKANAQGLIDVEASNASAAGQGVGVQWCHWVSGILFNGLGYYDQALSEAQQAADEAPELFLASWALPELVEAAARIGKTQVAGEALERLIEAASVGDSDWGLGVLARSRALLSTGEDAEGSYREAIERLGRTQLRPELARAHLVYGEWLRRENRRIDAREQLRIAHERFTTIGMEAFAERARAELQATGEHVRARAPEARDDLTAQERQIAELARDGLSNPEIGARLFLSPRTVEWHLRHVFSKLGIRSRRQLGAALPSANPELVGT